MLDTGLLIQVIAASVINLSGGLRQRNTTIGKEKECEEQVKTLHTFISLGVAVWL